MPIRAIARLIQTMLYARRFFPYYVYNILGGIEEDGELVSHILSHGILVICLYYLMRGLYHNINTSFSYFIRYWRGLLL